MNPLRRVQSAVLDHFSLIRKDGKTRTTGGGWKVKLECGHVLRHAPLSRTGFVTREDKRGRSAFVIGKRVRCGRCKA